MKLVKNENQKNMETVSDKEAEEAFIKILRWIGEDPTREGLLETPRRVTKAFVTLLGVSNNPSLVGSSPIHLKIFINASSASLSETVSMFF